MLKRFVLLAAVILWLVAIPGGGQETDRPIYATTNEAAEAIIGPLRANEFDSFSEAIDEHFENANGEQISGVIKQFLAEDEFFDYQELILEERLGQSFVRELYVLRTNENDFLFFELFMARTKEGWFVHNFKFNSDLSEFVPHWHDP